VDAVVETAHTVTQEAAGVSGGVSRIAICTAEVPEIRFGERCKKMKGKSGTVVCITLHGGNYQGAV